jgi:hypothetical protein
LVNERGVHYAVKGELVHESLTFNVDGRERPYRLELINGTPLLLGYGANLSNADLSGAKLAGLDLRSVSLRGANLGFADLSGCNLAFADLSGANAVAADFRGANLLGATFHDTVLIGADLRGAAFDTRAVRGAYLSDELEPGYLTRLGVTSPSEPPDDILRDAPAVATVVASTTIEPRRGDRVHNYDDLLESLSDGVAQLATSEKWTQYLDVQSRFHTYSSNNVMLIMLQNPYATRVAGYRAWQALDHQVMAKESALRIFAPMKYKRDDALEGERASEVRGFKLVPVFDISQTEGPELPDVVSKLSGLAPEGVFATLTEFASTIGFRVELPETLESGANGDTTHSLGRIRVVASNSEAQQVKTLAHEIGHALLHDPEVSGTKELTRGLMELEAESTAYVICAALGMDTSDYSFGYVAGWAGGAPEAVQGIKASTSRIQKATSAVLRNFEAEAITVGDDELANPKVAIAREAPNRESSRQVVDAETFLRLSGRLAEVESGPQRNQVRARVSNGLPEGNAVENSRRDGLGGNCESPSAVEFAVPDSPVQFERHLGD